MGQAVLMLDPVGDGVYEVPEIVAVTPDEPLETLEELIEPKQERGKVKLDGEIYMATIYVERVGGMRYPYMLVSELEGLL